MSPLPAVEIKSAAGQEHQDVVCHDGVCTVSMDFASRLQQHRAQLRERAGSTDRIANDLSRQHQDSCVE